MRTPSHRGRSLPWLLSEAWRSRRWPASSSAERRPACRSSSTVSSPTPPCWWPRRSCPTCWGAAWPDIARWSRGRQRSLEHLGLEPLLDLGLRLGEGSGACLALPVVEAAARLLREMATFDAAGVSEKTWFGDAPRERGDRRHNGSAASGSAGARHTNMTHCRAQRVGADRSGAESGDEEEKNGPRASGLAGARHTTGIAERQRVGADRSGAESGDEGFEEPDPVRPAWPAHGTPTSGIAERQRVGADRSGAESGDEETVPAWAWTRRASSLVRSSTCSAWATSWRARPHAGVTSAWVRRRTGSHP